MHIKTQFSRFSLAAVIGCAALPLVNAAPEEEIIQPSFTIEAGPAILSNPQPNYAMKRPLPSRESGNESTMSREEYEAVKARANSYISEAKPPPTQALSPTTTPHLKLWNFNGHSETENIIPPDTHGALGTTHFIEVTNTHIDMYKRGVPLTLVKHVTLQDFFYDDYHMVDRFTDPRVVYDSFWKRWIVIVLACPESTTTQYLLIAVSKTDDPTSEFWLFKTNVAFHDGDFFDYPQLGIDQAAVLITGNIFSDSDCDSQDNFAGADFFAIPKENIYNGLGWRVPVFAKLVGTLAPPIVLDLNANTYLIAAPAPSTSETKLTKYKATNTGNPDLTKLSPSTITVAAYSMPADADQPGITVLLDTGDARFVNASTQNGDDLWQVHTVGTGTDAWPRPRWYRFNTATGTVKQWGYTEGTIGSKDFNASITANTAGDCFTTFTSTTAGSPTGYPAVYLSGKLNADTRIAYGVNAYTSKTYDNIVAGGRARWGDYSAVTVDPTDSTTAWLVNEKVDDSTDDFWGSRIVRFGY